MRLLVLALAVPALAQPALAHEHSRHHARAWTHSHHAYFHHGSRHHARAWAARRHHGFAFAAVGEPYGGFEDRQAEYWAVAPGARILADRPFARRVDPAFASSYAQEPVTPRVARRVSAGEGGHGALDAMIARHAQLNGLPESLVHRVVIRESRYNARVVGRGGAMGLMQIKYSTARAMGYSGSPSGLLDPETNLTYAVRYLAGAYRAARGNAGAAVSNYARGYYGAAKRAGFSAYQGERRPAI
jgi:soluble lytic murein transglycosylase-like protein